MSKTIIIPILTFIGIYLNCFGEDSSIYKNNRAPLVQKAYVELPLGSIKAQGWLEEMLERQQSGATGRMDVLYPQIMGARNGWLGGDGDQWERGPYWIDGLLPLAYLLDDKQLKAKVQPWIEWAIDSQREDGYFGPDKDYPYEFGLQRDNSSDWWPRMVMLKILQQYHSATGDNRVIDFMTKYFRYQLKTLPERPLGYWTYWARFRVADNMLAVYWLYNITGDSFLLDLSTLLHKQGYDFTKMFLETDLLSQFNSIHCVNLAQGIKEPIVYYQQRSELQYLNAVKKGFADLKKFNGQPQGMYGGDEGLHGKNPTQGSELCAAVELMFSLEKMTEITGDVAFADHLERIAFNALPAQISDDYMYKQYFQQPNQVMVTRHSHNFYEDPFHANTDVVFGTLSGYPCCYSNMHQGWPKFTQHLWYATPDDGVAALVFSPSKVSLNVGKGELVTIIEETSYPMDDEICFTIAIQKKSMTEKFPFHVRIPSWCMDAAIFLNDKSLKKPQGGTIEIIDRQWRDGDKLVLKLPMNVRISTWYENSVVVERGPLVYALRMSENWEKISLVENERAQLGKEYYTVKSTDKWNYGILASAIEKPEENFTVKIDKQKQNERYFWNINNAPVSIKVKAKQLANWKLYNDKTGPLPFSVSSSNCPEQEIELIPYGCTTLRISEFPLVR